MRSAPVKRIDDVVTLRAAQFPEDAEAAAVHNVRPEVYHEINNFYTATVYQKGRRGRPHVLKRLIVGHMRFAPAWISILSAMIGHAAELVEDFIGCFETVSGRAPLSIHALVRISAFGTPESHRSQRL